MDKSLMNSASIEAIAGGVLEAGAGAAIVPSRADTVGLRLLRGKAVVVAHGVEQPPKKYTFLGWSIIIGEVGKERVSTSV